MKRWPWALAFALLLVPCKLEAQRVSITFDSVASGTLINNQYGASGVTFACIAGNSTTSNACVNGNVYAETFVANNSPPNVVSLSPTSDVGPLLSEQTGYVKARFTTPVSFVSIDVQAHVLHEIVGLGAKDNKPFMQAFGKQDPSTGKNPLLATVRYAQSVANLTTTVPGTWETLTIQRNSADIQFVVFSTMYTPKSSTVYGVFDNLWTTAPAADQYPYLGCYTDDANRAMPIRLMSSGATVASCIAAAKAKNLPYAALQWRGQCWAGYTPAYKIAAESECNTPCTANPPEMCGGSWRSSVYSTNVVLAAPPPGAYVGCYTDDGNRALDATLIPGSATVESCFSAAKARGFAYAGLQFQGQCYAGPALGYAKVDDAECNTKCSANASETCGGGWRNSVYATNTGTATLPSVKVLYKGCYTDDANRALEARIIDAGATPETCIRAAKAMGYAYAGLQWYGQCWAGNTLGYNKVADSECNAPCNADAMQKCGGEWRSSMYSTR